MRCCKYKQTVVVARMSKISNVIGSNAFRETFKHSTNDVVHYFPSHMARGESKQHKTAYIGANQCVHMPGIYSRTTPSRLRPKLFPFHESVKFTSIPTNKYYFIHHLIMFVHQFLIITSHSVVPL